ncbi:MAG: HTH domain-containing protein [Bacteroidota bacterium]
MKLLEDLKRIERVDRLIRLKATGSPKELAVRLGISKRSIYNIIENMKAMGASIYYCHRQRSYCYERELEFIYGFRDGEGKKIFGGNGDFNIWVQDFCIGRVHICHKTNEIIHIQGNSIPSYF